MKQLIVPQTPRGEVICAVYKMIFDDGSYYVGSTINLTQRINGWRFKLNSGIDKNYRVTAAFKQSATVTFEILEIIDDPVFRKFREDGYIKINIGKPLCLNIASNSINNIGIKQNPNKKIYKGNYEPVVKIDDLGRIVEQYESVAEAERKNKTNHVSECFRDSLRKVNGMMFRKIDKDGNIIPAPFIPLKERKPRRTGYKISNEALKIRRERNRVKRLSPNYTPPLNAKEVYQYSLDNELVAVHKSFTLAALVAGSDPKTFRKAIKRSPNNFTKGYIWKYA